MNGGFSFLYDLIAIMQSGIEYLILDLLPFVRIKKFWIVKSYKYISMTLQLQRFVDLVVKLNIILNFW